MNLSDKKAFRDNAKRIRAAIPEAGADEKNLKIKGILMNIPEYIQADIVLVYASAKDEADTYDIIKEALLTGKKVAVPKVIRRGIMEFYYISSLSELTAGYYDIPEPVTEDIFEPEVVLKNADESGNNISGQKVLMLVPGLAFDKEMHRMGYGGGFYDRYIERLNESGNRGCGITIAAICFEEQIYEAVPYEVHDRLMDMIITDAGIIKNATYMADWRL